MDENQAKKTCDRIVELWPNTGRAVLETIERILTTSAYEFLRMNDQITNLFGTVERFDFSKLCAMYDIRFGVPKPLIGMTQAERTKRDQRQRRTLEAEIEKEWATIS